MIKLYFFFFVILVAGCKTKTMPAGESLSENQTNVPYFVNMYGDTIPRVVMSPEEWKQKLSPQEYYVLREKGTERAFSGKFHNHKADGFYTCKGCGQVLFNSKHKFDSGTGWPSFYEVVDTNAFIFDSDYDIGYERKEVMCGKCKGHLGHVFPDGPAPTGLRYCINSVSLDFIKTENTK